MAGAQPSFSDVHILKALLALYKGRLSRQALVERLGVGEGSVRTILKRLKTEGLIRSSKSGHDLTEEGRGRVQSHLERFSIPKHFNAKDMDPITGEGMQHSLIVIYCMAEKIKTGMEERDVAFFAGARGALAIVYKKGRLSFPSGEVEVSDFPGLEAGIQGLGLKNEDLVVIAFSPEYSKAEDGALAVALSLS